MSAWLYVLLVVILGVLLAAVDLLLGGPTKSLFAPLRRMRRDRA
jgi:hypothetical protein